MRAAVLGAGPGGLNFAISLKLRDPSHEVTVIERNKETVVLSTSEGIYWINAGRPLSWLRKLSGKNRFSFWVRVDQIRRFRPAEVGTAAELSP